MRFFPSRPTASPLLLLLVFSATTQASGRAETDFCQRASTLCEIAMSWDDCSELYIQSMKAFEHNPSPASKRRLRFAADRLGF